MTSLAEVFSDDNRLTALPPEIGNLTTLYLDENQFTSLPPEIHNLRSLRFLSLRGTDIKELPPEFGDLTNLYRVSIEPTMKIPPEAEN